MNIESIRAQFPILEREFNGRKLVYLDSAATAQKPRAVIDVITNYYLNHNANVHRGVYKLAEESTNLYTEAHQVVGDFIGAEGYEEIVFTANATHSLNLIAHGYGKQNLSTDDVVVLSELEHHSNIVPWQILQKDLGFKIEWLPVDMQGRIQLEYLKFLATKYRERLKILSISHHSNVTDAMVDVAQARAIVKSLGTIIALDVSQSITHVPINVKLLGVDFVYFSGHKLYGPTGIGVLWGRKELLESMSPYIGGGDMVRHVEKGSAVWNDLPWKFEPGTPNMAGAVGLMAAIRWFKENVNYSELIVHYDELMKNLLEGLKGIRGVKIVGSDDLAQRNTLVAFELKGLHPHDVAGMLDEYGIAIRAGYHCAEPVHSKLEIGPTSRVSFGVYTEVSEIEYFIDTLSDVVARIV